MLKRRDRVSFAGLELLGEIIGTGPVLIGEDPIPGDFSDAQRAMALAEGADQALALIVETAGSPGGSRGKARRIWRAMTPDTAAASMVFTAHGLAAITARMAGAPGHHLSVAAQNRARELLRSHLPWDERDEQEVSRIVDAIDPDTAEGLEQARLGVAFGACVRVTGEADARALPGFSPWFGDHADPPAQYATGLAWGICWNHSLARWLTLTDPEGLRRAG